MIDDVLQSISGLAHLNEAFACGHKSCGTADRILRPGFNVVNVIKVYQGQLRRSFPSVGGSWVCVRTMCDERT